MDEIRLEVQEVYDEAYGGPLSEVAIFINDRNLIDILREIELPFAQEEGLPERAGSYAGLRPEMMFLPSRYLLGEPVYGDKVDIFQCECGSLECWPFSVRITMQNNKVIWDEFEQPHRTENHPGGGWSYDRLKPFVFDKRQYIAELSKVSIPLEPDFQNKADIYYDPELGWFLCVYYPFFYFPKTEKPATLRLSSKEFLCEIINAKTKWWMAWPISEPSGEWKIDEWEDTW